MRKFKVNGIVTVSCYTEVMANSAVEALEIANGRYLAEIHIDSGSPVDECWHIENDGEPVDLTVDTD
jgi:hypothetical protein